MYIEGVKHKYLKRTFLAPASSGHTSYILAEIEDTRNGENKWGNNLLTIADDRRRIQLEFLLGTADVRKESVDKADLLVETVTQFRNVLLAECHKVENFKQSGKDGKKQTSKNGRIKKPRKRKD